MIKLSKILYIIFFISIASNAFSQDKWEICKSHVIDNSHERGDDLYDEVIKKCGYKKFSKNNCDELYDKLYLECYKEKIAGFCSSQIGFFALYENFNQAKLAEKCTDKKQMNRKDFGEMFCDGK